MTSPWHPEKTHLTRRTRTLVCVRISYTEPPLSTIISRRPLQCVSHWKKKNRKKPKTIFFCQIWKNNNKGEEYGRISENTSTNFVITYKWYDFNISITFLIFIQICLPKAVYYRLWCLTPRTYGMHLYRIMKHYWVSEASNNTQISNR